MFNVLGSEKLGSPWASKSIWGSVLFYSALEAKEKKCIDIFPDTTTRAEMTSLSEQNGPIGMWPMSVKSAVT